MDAHHARALTLAMASPFATGRIIGGMLAGILAIAVLMVFLFSRGGVSGDCGWSAPVAAWVDTDGDGQRDAGEPPLEGVRITVNDTVNSYPDVGGPRYTNWEGDALAQVWLPGCPKARFEVTSDPPAGYTPTTARAVAVEGVGYGDRTLWRPPDGGCGRRGCGRPARRLAARPVLGAAARRWRGHHRPPRAPRRPRRTRAPLIPVGALRAGASAERRAALRTPGRAQTNCTNMRAA